VKFAVSTPVKRFSKSCSIVNGYRRFRRTCCLHRKGRKRTKQVPPKGFYQSAARNGAVTNQNPVVVRLEAFSVFRVFTTQACGTVTCLWDTVSGVNRLTFIWPLSYVVADNLFALGSHYQLWFVVMSLIACRIFCINQYVVYSAPQWLRGLRLEPSSPARIPLEAWISVFVLSCVQVAALRWAHPPPRSPTDCV
jgi:hypothetical protein